ncbi:MAG: hypothetical protein WCO57_02595 [Verrucomicrobiota bacterium]
MTNPTSIKTLADLAAIRNTGRDKITAIVGAYPADLTDKRGRWQHFQQNPLCLTKEEAMQLRIELSALESICEEITPGVLEHQLQEHDAALYRDRAKEIVGALELHLESTISPLPTWKSATIKWFSELPSKIYAPAVTGPERDSLLDERDKREADALATESNIALARAAIERFKLYPTPAHYGDAVGTISTIKF